MAAIERAILDTARRRFLEDGYDAVAMEGVAAETGVSKGTLYARYPSKEALFTAVVEASVEEWSKSTSRIDRHVSEDIGERLRQHAHKIAASLVRADVRAFQRLLIANRERFPELSRAMYDSGYRHTVRLIAQEIEDAARRDGIPVRAAADVAALFISSITGWQLQESAKRHLAEADIAAFGERVVELLLAGRQAW